MNKTKIEKVKAKILCESCNKTFLLEIKSPSDLFGVKCKYCKSSEETYILDHGFKSDGKPVTLGVHSGCGQK